MDTLLQVLFWCPRCWRNFGYSVFVACSGLALLGHRATSRVNRIENKTGVVIDLSKAFDALPFPVPTTAGGFALVVAFAIIGVALALAGKWAERF